MILLTAILLEFLENRRSRVKCPLTIDNRFVVGILTIERKFLLCLRLRFYVSLRVDTFLKLVFLFLLKEEREIDFIICLHEASSSIQLILFFSGLNGCTIVPLSEYLFITSC